MTNKPLMAKATAVWLVDNTTLTFKQIADFCGMHELEVQGIADGARERRHGPHARRPGGVEKACIHALLRRVSAGIPGHYSTSRQLGQKLHGTPRQRRCHRVTHCFQ